MSLSTVELARWCRECYPEYDGQLFMNLTDISKLFGMEPDHMREFMHKAGVPYYTPVKRKLYCVPEVMDEFRKVRYRSA